MVAKCGKYRQISQQFEIEWLRNVEKNKRFRCGSKGNGCEIGISAQLGLKVVNGDLIFKIWLSSNNSLGSCPLSSTAI